MSGNLSGKLRAFSLRSGTDSYRIQKKNVYFIQHCYIEWKLLTLFTDSCVIEPILSQKHWYENIWVYEDEWNFGIRKLENLGNFNNDEENLWKFNETRHYFKQKDLKISAPPPPSTLSSSQRLRWYG